MGFQKIKPKILMFPWLAHGHISPFLELSKSLINKNFDVYLCSSHVNLNSAKKIISEEYANAIHLLELDVPTLPDLPREYHTTKNLSSHLMGTLKKAFDMSKENFFNILVKLNPDVLIYDTIQPWAPTMAYKLGIPAVAFVSTSATMTAFMIHHYENQDAEFALPEIYLNEHEEANFEHLIHAEENFYKTKGRFFECLEKSCCLILIKSAEEIEGKYLKHLSVLAKKKIMAVGPLVQPSSSYYDPFNIIEWLDKKETGSTVFVSFGTEYFLTKKEIKEVAYGLEYSCVNFIWVIRSPAGEELILENVLPNGFLERIKDRGLVIQGWAPQVQILEHPNTGGFVSHCGWSSMMEGIKCCVPIIGIPMHLDQPINARLLKEIGVGLEVDRDRDGDLVRDEIARVIKEVVKKESGKAARRREKELSEEIGRKEVVVVDEVVNDLIILCKMKWLLHLMAIGHHHAR